jgi:D-beta-D-heptose 7-phosphate kinase/D-beta-D-heptose 1-phosphate adenosyltransferase
VGEDLAGDKLRRALGAAGVDDVLTVADGGRPTTLKTRIIAHHQQVVRADREDTEDLGGALESALLAGVRRALDGSDALVVSDYQKGVVTPRVMKAVRDLARRRGLPLLVDPKVGHFALYRGVTLVKPNQSAAERATGVRIRDEASLLAAGQRILKTLRCAAALITRGEQGLSLFQAGRPPSHIAAAAREVFDVTGAGDTVMAALALALAGGASLEDGAQIANCAAGVVVGKLGTATADPAEVLDALDRARP